MTPGPAVPVGADALAGPCRTHARLVGGLAGTTDPADVAALLRAWCEAFLGSPCVAVPWALAGSGLAVAVDLADGRALVVKARPAAQEGRIAESRALQLALADADLPVPRPVGPLAPFGPAGIAGAEGRVDGASPIDARAPGASEVMAGLLHRVVQVASGAAPPEVALHEPWGIALPPDELWPDPPHDPAFDLVGTAEGAGWIDAAAVGLRARMVAGAAGRPRVVGHVDWRAEHVLVDDAGTVRAVLDWDSLVRAPEEVVVGLAAAGWTITWGPPDPHPTAAESRAFVAAYEGARGAPFTAAERDLLDAAHGYVVAYGARCEHSDERTGRVPAPAPDGWRRLLAARGDRALT